MNLSASMQMTTARCFGPPSALLETSETSMDPSTRYTGSPLVDAIPQTYASPVGEPLETLRPMGSRWFGRPTPRPLPSYPPPGPMPFLSGQRISRMRLRDKPVVEDAPADMSQKPQAHTHRVQRTPVANGLQTAT